MCPYNDPPQNSFPDPEMTSLRPGPRGRSSFASHVLWRRVLPGGTPPREPGLTYDCQPGPWAEGVVIISTSEYNHSKMYALDLLSPARSQERPRGCLTYNCEPGAVSKEDLSVRTVTGDREENRSGLWRGGALVSGGPWDERCPHVLYRELHRTFLTLGPESRGPFARFLMIVSEGPSKGRGLGEQARVLVSLASFFREQVTSGIPAL